MWRYYMTFHLSNALKIRGWISFGLFTLAVMRHNKARHVFYKNC